MKHGRDQKIGDITKMEMKLLKIMKGTIPSRGHIGPNMCYISSTTKPWFLGELLNMNRGWDYNHNQP